MCCDGQPDVSSPSANPKGPRGNGGLFLLPRQPLKGTTDCKLSSLLLLLDGYNISVALHTETSFLVVGHTAGLVGFSSFFFFGLFFFFLFFVPFFFLKKKAKSGVGVGLARSFH